MLCDTPVESFLGGGHVTGVRTATGSELRCDLVIAGVGVLPETALAATAGLPCDNGISVDELTRTADPNIFAAGDCTCHPNALLGRRIRLESVQNATEQAKAAALNMLGGSEPYRELPWFWSDQYDLKLQIAGIPSNDDQLVVRGSPDEGAFAVFYLADGQLTAVEAVNRPRAFMAGKKIIAARAAIDVDMLLETHRSMSEIAREALAQRR